MVRKDQRLSGAGLIKGRFKMEYRLLTIVRYNYRDYNTPSKPNTHARLKTMQKETSTRTKR